VYGPPAFATGGFKPELTVTVVLTGWLVAPRSSVTVSVTVKDPALA
jgi:hypothetical protein